MIRALNLMTGLNDETLETLTIDAFDRIRCGTINKLAIN